MTWLSNKPLDSVDWARGLRGFLEVLGKNCIGGGGSLIGHIKGVATVAGSPCLQLSLVSLNQPACVEGTVPDKTNELHITLNVLVFGMSADGLAAALNTTHEQALTSWPGSIEVEVLPAAVDYPVALHD